VKYALSLAALLLLVCVVTFLNRGTARQEILIPAQSSRPQTPPTEKPKPATKAGTTEAKTNNRVVITAPFDIIGSKDSGLLYSFAQHVQDGSSEADLERRLRSGDFFLINKGAKIELHGNIVVGMVQVKVVGSDIEGWIPSRGLFKE